MLRCDCEGIVQQSAVFGEDLHLIRRIEARVGSNEFVMKDRVVNHGFYRTPHMFLYHINVGHPVLADGSRYLAPIRQTPLGGARRRLPAAECRVPHAARPASELSRAGLAARDGGRR